MSMMMILMSSGNNHFYGKFGYWNKQHFITFDFKCAPEHGIDQHKWCSSLVPVHFYKHRLNLLQECATFHMLMCSSDSGQCAELEFQEYPGDGTHIWLPGTKLVSLMVAVKSLTAWSKSCWLVASAEEYPTQPHGKDELHMMLSDSFNIGVKLKTYNDYKNSIRRFYHLQHWVQYELCNANNFFIQIILFQSYSLTNVVGDESSQNDLKKLKQRWIAHLSMYPDGEPFRPSSLSCSAARICGFCIICAVSWRAGGHIFHSVLMGNQSNLTERMTVILSENKWKSWLCNVITFPLV